MMTRLPGIALALLVLAGGCTMSRGTPSPAALPMRAQLVASGFDQPLYLASPPGDSGRLFVVEQVTGRIRVIKEGKVLPVPFLDLGGKVSKKGGEMGLLGLAFHPGFQRNGWFYLNYIPDFDQGGIRRTRIERYRIHPDNPGLADINSAFTVLEFEQPYGNHNGGMLEFGPDGFLYIGTGDGGAAGDPQNRAQNLQSLLGKMLRIDVSQGNPYTIPPDNPFQNGSGLPEILAYGLRNPWRYSWDPETGDWFIGDVGQNMWEEISVMPAGKTGLNFGWRIQEGSHCFTPRVDCPTGNLVQPIHEYGHAQVPGASVTGGYVYRGSAIPEARGRYFFADFTNGIVGSLRYDKGKATDVRDHTRDIAPREGKISLVSSFGRDAEGELYVLDYQDGEVYKLVPAKR